jgi:hypothetical protein
MNVKEMNVEETRSYWLEKFYPRYGKWFAWYNGPPTMHYEDPKLFQRLGEAVSSRTRARGPTDGWSGTRDNEGGCFVSATGKGRLKWTIRN